MGQLRVVVYAEGPGGGFRGLPPEPGRPLTSEWLGAAHVFVRRCLETEGIPSGAIRFDSPLRTRGRIARGGDLEHAPTLRRLLTWIDAALRPDLAVVLTDADGDAGRG